MTNIIVTTFLVLAALSWFTYRSDDVSKQPARPAREALSEVPGIKIALPAPRAPEPVVGAERAVPQNCGNLARDFAAVDFKALGRLGPDLRTVVDSPRALLEKIVDIQTRDACHPGDEELRKLLADLKQDCTGALADTFEPSLWRDWCFRDFVTARYRLTAHVLRDTPLTAIDDPEMLKNLYFGLGKRALSEPADGKEDLVLARMLELDPRDAFAAEQRLSRDLGLTHGHAIGIDLHDLFPDADREIAASIARLEAIDPESPYARSARLTLAIDHDDYDTVERLVSDAGDSAVGPYYRAWLTYRRGDVDGAKRELAALILRENASVPGGPTWEISTALRNLEDGAFAKAPRDVFPTWSAPLGHTIVEPLAMVTPSP